MSERIKIIFLQILMVATGIVGVMSIEGLVYHLMGDTFQLEWYHPISILVAAVLCALPSLLLVGHDTWSKPVFIIRLIIHALSLYAMIAGLGYLFKWYTVLSGFIYLSIGYFAVYIFVWFATIWIVKRDANAINAALDDIRDEE